MRPSLVRGFILFRSDKWAKAVCRACYSSLSRRPKSLSPMRWRTRRGFRQRLDGLRGRSSMRTGMCAGERSTSAAMSQPVQTACHPRRFMLSGVHRLVNVEPHVVFAVAPASPSRAGRGWPGQSTGAGRPGGRAYPWRAPPCRSRTAGCGARSAGSCRAS